MSICVLSVPNQVQHTIASSIAWILGPVLRRALLLCHMDSFYQLPQILLLCIVARNRTGGTACAFAVPNFICVK